MKKIGLFLFSCFLLLSSFAAHAAPLIEFFNTSHATITSLHGVTLSWRVRDAVRVEFYDTPRNQVYNNLPSESNVQVFPQQNATYSIRAYSQDGSSSSQQVRIQVVQTRIDFFTASSTMINVGQGVTLSWKTSNAERVHLFDGDKNTLIRRVGRENSMQVFPSKSASYVLEVHGPNGHQITKKIDIGINPNQAPDILMFRSSAPAVSEGEPVRFEWNTKFATRVELRDNTGRVLYNLPPEGSTVVVPAQTGTYTLIAFTATGVQSFREMNVHVTNIKPIIVFFNASSDSIFPGQSVRLSWRVDKASTRIEIEGSGIPNFTMGVATNGSIEVTPTQTTFYRLTTQSTDGTIVQATVRVLVSIIPPR